MKTFAIVCLGFALTGCANFYAPQAKQESDQFYDAPQVRNGAQCLQLGFKQGTGPYENCRFSWSRYALPE